MNDIFKLTLIIFITTIKNSFAYIDPGSASIIITAIISFFATLILYFKQIFYFIKNFYKKHIKKNIEKS
jgi:hypothetical protein